MKKKLFTSLLQLILISGVLGQEIKKNTIGGDKIDLAGAWSFRMDSLNIGGQEQWYYMNSHKFNPATVLDESSFQSLEKKVKSK